VDVLLTALLNAGSGAELSERFTIATSLTEVFLVCFTSIVSSTRRPNIFSDRKRRIKFRDNACRA
jgi:hypothetical protein